MNKKITKNNSYKDQYNDDLEDIYRPDNNDNAIHDGNHCLSCHKIVNKTDKYCTSCGEKIIRCSICASVIEEHDDFCPYCGVRNHKSINTELDNLIKENGEYKGKFIYRMKQRFMNESVRFKPFLPLEVCLVCGGQLGDLGNNKYNYCPHCGINLNHKNSRSVR